MIVRFYRYSGYPPNPLLKEVIKREHMEGYDQIVADLGVVNEENKEAWPERMQALDKSLLDKYPRHEDRVLNHTADIEELIKFYGSTLAFCIEKENEKEIFTCYIMDMP